MTPTTIVTGPPGAGKSTWVAAQFQPGDLLIDVDALFRAVSGMELYDEHRAALLPFVLDARYALLRALSKHGGPRHAWIVTTEGDAIKLAQMINDLGADLVVIATPAEECLRRIENDPRRVGRLLPWRDLTDRWWRLWMATNGQQLKATVVEG